MFRRRDCAKKDGPTRSCGCLRLQMAREQSAHSMVKTPPYLVWRNFRSRCDNPKNPKFKDYGGRGITVCGRWTNSFEDFWEDMKDGYEPGLYLDRIDNNGNYAPGNCRWITPRVSTENRRNAILVTFEGESMNLSEAARRSGIDYSIPFDRFKRGVPESQLFVKGRIPK